LITDFLELTIACLATYRITRLIVQDEILNGPRNWIWKKFPPESNKFGYLFTCVWCTSVWVASLLVISRIIIPEATRVVEIVLALSAIAGLLSAHEDRQS